MVRRGLRSGVFAGDRPESSEQANLLGVKCTPNITGVKEGGLVRYFGADRV